MFESSSPEDLLRVSSPIRRIRIPFVFAVAAGLFMSGIVSEPAAAITKSEVEAVCSGSRDAYETYQEARSAFLTASEQLEQANGILVEAEAKEQRIRGQYESNRRARDELEPQLEAQAVDLYMQTVSSNSAGLVALDKPEDALVATQFMSTSAAGSREGLNQLSAITAELDRLGGDLEAVVSERTELRDRQQQLTTEQEEAMGSALDSYEHLTEDCKEKQREYEAEQARLRAEEEARRKKEAENRQRASAGGSSGGSPSVDSSSGGARSSVIDGVICPFTPGRTQFSNSYGAPRSGGRRHRGVDMMAPFNEPVYAIETGVVSVDNRGLGGKQIFLTADSGRSYYYAHLNGFNVSDGARVNQGDLIAFNGNSGNAEGTSPHVHLQIYPNGYRGGVINPYYAMAAVCF